MPPDTAIRTVITMETTDEDRHSLFGLIIAIAVAVVAAVLVLTAVFWFLGLIFDMAGWIARVAILAAVAALVWRVVTRRLARHDEV
jgi:archaellum biogenesis protein FlaJ (TadC family)